MPLGTDLLAFAGDILEHESKVKSFSPVDLNESQLTQFRYPTLCLELIISLLCVKHNPLNTRDITRPILQRPS